jgi:hypothetical protein
METTEPFYAEPDAHLQQGDIFRIEIVAPVADRQQRLFRTADGRHGSIAFERGEKGTVFHPDDLRDLLRATQRTDWHTDPFCNSPNSQPELVVVHANLIRHFIIATQTCDISGVDHPGLPYAMVLPIQTVEEICRTTPVQLLAHDGTTVTDTIHRYLMTIPAMQAMGALGKGEEYAEKLRQLLNEWTPAKNSSDRKNHGLIRDFLNKWTKKGFLYGLRSDSRFGVPECCVDFSAIYTVPTAALNEISSHRIAHLAGSYRDAFAQQFALRISRIATPKSISPEKF